LKVLGPLDLHLQGLKDEKDLGLTARMYPMQPDLKKVKELLLVARVQPQKIKGQISKMPIIARRANSQLQMRKNVSFLTLG